MEWYQMLQTILVEREGRFPDGVSHDRKLEGDEVTMGLVLDAMMEQYFLVGQEKLIVAVRPIANTIGRRAEEVVRSLAALAAISLTSNHIEERLLTIQEAFITEEGAMVVQIQFGGWLTHHLKIICDARAPVPN